MMTIGNVLPFIMAIFSDIHLGNNKTPVKHMLESLELAIFENDNARNWDLIVMPGDIFDKALTLTDPSIFEIIRWFHRLMNFCISNDIDIRIMRGTPSHDWNQCELLDTLYECYPAKDRLDFKYIDDLTYEHYERFNAHFLYMPDELNVEHQKTWEDVQKLMKDKGVDGFTHAFTHGFFGFQVPSHYNIGYHDEAKYRSIVTHAIYNGHDHSRKSFKNIQVPGSFERCVFGDEKPKGHLEVSVRKESDRVVFVENKNAKIYKTIDCSDKTLEESLELLNVAYELPPHSSIRIEGFEDDPIFKSYGEIKKTYGLIHFDTKIKPRIDESLELEIKERKKVEVVQITPMNLSNMILDRIKQTDTNPEVLASVERLIGDYVKG